MRSRSRAHIHARLLAGAEGAGDPNTLERLRVQGRNDSGDVTIALLPRRSGVLTAATLTSLFTAAVSLGFATRLSHLDGQTSAAVLLLVPATVAAYLSRAGEHPFATRMLIGVRALALVGGTFAVIMSAMIGAGLMKLEPVRQEPSQQAAKPTSGPATGEVQRLRCSSSGAPRSSGRGPGTTAHRLDCSLVRAHQAAEPTTRLRLNSGVLAISWLVAILACIVGAVLTFGYGLGLYVRKTAVG